MDMNFKKYKTVSFDIFDTLVSRRVYRPRDLFSLMQSTLATENFFISACERCGGIIEKTTLSSRPFYWCPHCQK
ncbi:hypothetical protein EOH21_00180 [Salmonella enterica]|nr:hypothetical protein [Salmonella enterica]